MIAAMSATSCSDDDNEKVVMPDPDPTTLGWVKQTTEFGTLPEYISVYKSPSELEGMKAIAFIAVADMSKQILQLSETRYILRLPIKSGKQNNKNIR